MAPTHPLAATSVWMSVTRVPLCVTALLELLLLQMALATTTWSPPPTHPPISD
jgi:hypothetical protein